MEISSIHWQSNCCLWSLWGWKEGAYETWWRWLCEEFTAKLQVISRRTSSGIFACIAKGSRMELILLRLKKGSERVSAQVLVTNWVSMLHNLHKNLMNLMWFPSYGSCVKSQSCLSCSRWSNMACMHVLRTRNFAGMDWVWLCSTLLATQFAKISILLRICGIIWNEDSKIVFQWRINDPILREEVLKSSGF